MKPLGKNKKTRFGRFFISRIQFSKLIPGFILFIGYVLLTPGISFSNTFYHFTEDNTINSKYLLAQVQTVDVPDLRGMRYNVLRIRRLLRQSGLQLGNVENIPNNLRVGEIIDQYPDPGSVVPYDTRVNVSVGIEQPIATLSRVVVPDLIGKTEDQALEILSEMKLISGEIQEMPTDSESGKIVRQFPASGALVQSGSQVNLYIAVPLMVRVPNLIGRNLDEARAIIERYELKIGNLRGEPSRRDNAEVIDQSLTAGSMVEKYTPIDLTYSIPDRDVLVPNVVGMPLDKARIVLAKAGLPIASISKGESDKPQGVVIAQSPDAGKSVDPGVNMKLIVSADKSVIPPWIYWSGGVLIAAVAGVFIRKNFFKKVEVNLKFEPSVDVGKQKVVFRDQQVENKSIRVKAIPDPGIQIIKKSV